MPESSRYRVKTMASALGLVLLLTITGFAQKKVSVARPVPERPDPSSAHEQLIPPPEALVYVQQTIDLSEQLGSEDNLMTLDGEPLPPMLTRNVTLGLVVDDLGHIVTRLVGVGPKVPPYEVLVTPQRGRPVPAVFVGLDAVTGLCVLKVDPAGFKPATTIHQGRISFQAGSASVTLFGFNPVQAVSRIMSFSRPRIHSFTGRITPASSDFRYSDASPLLCLVTPKLTPIQEGMLVVDESRSIIGIASHDTTVNGRSLIIPIDRVQQIASGVISAKGSLAYAWLGATGVTSYSPIATSTQKRTTDTGVRVTGIFPDSPADQAGMRTNDILLAINDRSVTTTEQLGSLLKQLPAGSEVAIKVKRGSEYRTLKAKLTPAPAPESGQRLAILADQLRDLEDKLVSLGPQDPARKDLEPKVAAMRTVMDSVLSPAPPDVRLRVRYGLEVAPLTVQLMRFFGVPRGLLVTSVSESGRATRTGLRAGDCIMSLGERVVIDASTLLQALDQTPQTPVIVVSRQRQELQLKLAQ